MQYSRWWVSPPAALSGARWRTSSWLGAPSRSSSPH
jgi:hypothetical protein